MAQKHAIVIGINQFEFLQPLRYAKRDALLMQEFLREEAGFENIHLFSDDSLEIAGNSTRPSRANLRWFLLDRFREPFLGSGDDLWFFFAGHGLTHNQCDYLMPSDGNPHDVQETGISVNFIAERLRRCGADNVVLILDACRESPTRSGEGIGSQAAQQARQMGVISFFACSPKEYSYEIEDIRQGAFTNVLVEGLRQYATVERLNQYLSHQVPKLVRSHYGDLARQTPYTIAEPISKTHLILMPRQATLQDVLTLKNDALTAEVSEDYGLARQLWRRVLASSPADSEAINAIENLVLKRHTVSNSSHCTSEVPQVITQTHRGQAEYFQEPLSKPVLLDMVAIPGGTFMMGAAENEEGAKSTEHPQRRVLIEPFFMSKYPITQAQYEAITGTNPSYFKGKNRPVESVTWDQAVEFCDFLSQRTGKQYRLPSEAEWEYACRANTTTPFSFGETITTDLANYRGTDREYRNTIYFGNYSNGPRGIYREQTTDVGILGSPNAFELHCMHGNVWEWCADPWHESYEGAPNDGQVWETESDCDSDYRLVRGGSWHNTPRYCRAASRDRFSRSFDFNSLGFRVSLSAPSPP